MGRGSDEAPRQDSQEFAAKDQVARAQGGDQSTTAVKPCMFWTLKVNITGLVNARRLKLDPATVAIDWTDNSQSTPNCTSTAPDKAAADVIRGRGSLSGDCSAGAKGWYLDAPKRVTLADGEDKVVDLVLRPAVWVAFEPRDHKTNDLIKDVRLKGNLSKIGDQAGKTLGDRALEIEHDSLRPGDTCKVLELGHDEFLLEIVGSVTSA